MKKFLKKFAFVLAATVATTTIVPAATVSAATEPTLKQSSKVLYVGGDETGNIGDTYRFTFNNAKGYTATWKSSKKSVATVDAKSGNIQAVAVGTTGIYATLTNKAGNAVELDAKVYVKQNAEKIGFGSLAAVKEALAVGDTAKVNVYRQVGTTKVWAQSDKTLITDTVVWTSSDANVATVDKWGKITAVAAGKATITATATQKEGNVAVVSKSFPVEVAAGLTDVKQTSENTIAATFAGDLSAVATKDNVKVYSMVGATKVNVLVKAVAFDKTDKTKAVITTYTSLVKGTEYVVEYAETSDTFKAADLSASAVAELRITPATVTKGVATDVVVKAYTADGVEIPAANVDTRITVSADTSAKYYFDATAKKITFFNIGDTAAIKASFHTYTYGTDYKEITIDAAAVITSVDVVVNTVSDAGTFTVYNTATPDFTKATSTLSVSDTAGYKVAVKTKDSAGTEKLSTSDSLFTFESSDATTLIVNGSNVFPVKAGVATVIVKYNGTPVGAYNVTIGAARVASDVTAKVGEKLSKGNSDDSLTLTVTTKDQFGADRTGVDAVTVDYVTGPVTVATFQSSAKAASTDANVTKFTFEGSAFTTAGTYQFKVTVDKQVRYVYFTVTDVASTAVGYYQLSGAGSSIDTALKVAEKTDSKTLTMDLASYTSTGYKKANITIQANSSVATSSAIAATGTAFYYAEIEKPSSYTGNFVVVSGGSVVINPVDVSNTADVKKMASGTYTIKVFKVESTDGKTVTTTAATVANVVINDTQTVPTVVVNKTVSAKNNLTDAIVNGSDVITITINDVKYGISKPITVGPTTAGSTFSLSKVTLAVPVNYNGTTGTFLQEVVVNTPVTLAK